MCGWGGKRFVLSRGDAGPFTGRPDLEIVLDGINDLMAMESAGDLVIYGTGAPAGNVSYVPEIGAHAGPTPEELHAFILAPLRVPLPSPLTHPTPALPVLHALPRDRRDDGVTDLVVLSYNIHRGVGSTASSTSTVSPT